MHPTKQSFRASINKDGFTPSRLEPEQRDIKEKQQDSNPFEHVNRL